MHLKAIKTAVARLLLGLLVAIIATGCGNVFAADDRFKMTVSVGAPLYFENGTGFFDLLTAEIFRRMDIEYEMVWLPPRRSLVYSNNGIYDGHIARTEAVEKDFSDLVRVPVNVLDFDFMVYTKNPDLQISDWEGLLPYSVGMISGWKIVEQNTVGAKSVVKVSNFDQLLALLDKGRIDVAILDRIMGGWTLRRGGYALGMVEPPLISKRNYIYLNRRHVDLVPEFTRIVKAIIQDGTYAKIHAEALAQR